MAIRTHMTASPDETERAAHALAGLVEPGDAIGLVGDLGAGKTRFVQGLARGLGLPPHLRVTSPTFTILNELRGGRMTLFHADLYRILDARELVEIGLDEVQRRGGGLLAVEWCDRFDVLGGDHLTVALRVTGDETRALEVEGQGPRSRHLALRWSALLDQLRA